MLKKIFKTLLIPLALVLVLFVSVVIWIWPKDSTLAEVPSLDGRFMATVVTSSGGGALGNTVTYVVLEDRQTKTGWPFWSYDKRNILMSGHYLDVGLSWKNETTLVVQYRSSYSNDIVFREESWKDIQIVYRDLKEITSGSAMP